MRRREFIVLLGGTVLPFSALAQQAGIPVVGFLSSRSPSESSDSTIAFRQGLSEVGFVEGQNLGIAFRWAEGRYDRLPALASDLVQLPVALIVAAGGPPPVIAAKAVTSTIPIVFTGVTDPVRVGLVASLGRPGGTVTGIGLFNNSLLAKRLELLHELVPTAAAIGMLVNPTNPVAEADIKEALEAARALKRTVRTLEVGEERDLEDAFATLTKLNAGALLVVGDPSLDGNRDKIISLAARHAIPAMYAWRENVLAGGLVSYGTSLTDNYRQAGIYVGRILKGEKPADLPVLQPTKFELVINQKTAKTLGLTIPQSILLRADEVIE